MLGDVVTLGVAFNGAIDLYEIGCEQEPTQRHVSDQSADSVRRGVIPKAATGTTPLLTRSHVQVDT